MTKYYGIIPQFLANHPALLDYEYLSPIEKKLVYSALHCYYNLYIALLFIPHGLFFVSGGSMPGFFFNGLQFLCD